MSKPRLLWHSNAPYVPTGYGMQTGLFLPLLAERYDVACSSFYGLEGAPLRWEGIPVFPGLGGDFGNDTLPQHAQRFFGGSHKDGLVVTLMDVWVLDPAQIAKMNVVAWVPVDHEPAPDKIVDFFTQSGAIPMAMSKFGLRMLADAGLDPLYVPHAVDTETYRPILRDDARQASFPDGAFVVGMVAANKGHPSRKGFAQALLAYSRFASRHENAFLYLHTILDPTHGHGENLPALLRHLEIPRERVRIADQYCMMHNPYTAQDMARIYSALDVLLNPSFGEGFGVPVIEAHACGVPAVVTDSTAMAEVCAAGWKVDHYPYWSGLASWQTIPDVDGIERALEKCYQLPGSERAKLAQAARKHALGYDLKTVVSTYMLPALREAEKRFEKRANPELKLKAA